MKVEKRTKQLMSTLITVQLWIIQLIRQLVKISIIAQQILNKRILLKLLIQQKIKKEGKEHKREKGLKKH